MSRSYKKPVYKDRRMKDIYWKRVRRRQRNEIRSGKHPEDVSDAKTIMNDYDYCDFTCGNYALNKHEDLYDDWEKQWITKLKRK